MLQLRTFIIQNFNQGLMNSTQGIVTIWTIPTALPGNDIDFDFPDDIYDVPHKESPHCDG